MILVCGSVQVETLGIIMENIVISCYLLLVLEETVSLFAPCGVSSCAELSCNSSWLLLLLAKFGLVESSGRALWLKLQREQRERERAKKVENLYLYPRALQRCLVTNSSPCFHQCDIKHQVV